MLILIEFRFILLPAFLRRRIHGLVSESRRIACDLEKDFFEAAVGESVFLHQGFVAVEPRHEGGKQFDADALLVVSTLNSLDVHCDVPCRCCIDGHISVVVAKAAAQMRFSVLDVFLLNEQRELQGAAVLGLELQWTSEGSELALLHDGNFVREQVGFFHCVRCQDDDPVFLDFIDVAPDKATVQRVHASCWFIQDDQLPFADGGQRNRKSAFHAAAESRTSLQLLGCQVDTL
mmetsp:Transcript_2195/g.6094  ORF Transcript_2195/g.6094 Transcript_2195/m.6094 type:complete len:233 (+) Transcript_2195:2076-2774(+)